MNKFVLMIIMGCLLIFGIFYYSSISTGNSVKDIDTSNLASMTIKVAIPCSGHAPVIFSNLESAGVYDTQFQSPNIFSISYDSSKITQDQILNLPIFQQYKATIIN